MKLNVHNQVGARFKFLVHKGDGKPVKETGWFHNIVLDTGLNRMSVGDWINRCCVGTGNSTPIATQVSLDSFVASTSTQQSNKINTQASILPYYKFASVTWRFSEGMAAGNLSEVGLGWGDQNLWNRALIRDANGNPTTITVLSDEYLDVVSEVRLYFPTETISKFNLLDKNGLLLSEHTYSGKSSNINTSSNRGASFNRVRSPNDYQGRVYTGHMGGITGMPLGSYADFNATLQSNPTPTSISVAKKLNLTNAVFAHKSFDIPMTIFNSDSDNYTLSYQFEMDPPIVKTNAQEMTYTFDFSWGRYESP